jgi:hypothetical protein
VPALPPAPPCRLSHLDVATVDPHRGVFFNGATGSLVGWVSFTNEGAPCSLLGRPRVVLFGGTVRLAVSEAPRCDWPQQPPTVDVGTFRPPGT